MLKRNLPLAFTIFVDWVDNCVYRRTVSKNALRSGDRLILFTLIIFLVVVAVVLAHRIRFCHNIYTMGGNGYSAAMMGAANKHDGADIYIDPNLYHFLRDAKLLMDQDRHRNFVIRLYRSIKGLARSG